MAMTSDWFDPTERDGPETEPAGREALARESKVNQASVKSTEVQAEVPTLLAPLDPALKELLQRKDDRLLRDVGLSRESPFAEVAKFWADWSRQRGPWGL